MTSIETWMAMWNSTLRRKVMMAAACIFIQIFADLTVQRAKEFGLMLLLQSRTLGRRSKSILGIQCECLDLREQSFDHNRKANRAGFIPRLMDCRILLGNFFHHGLQ